VLSVSSKKPQGFEQLWAAIVSVPHANPAPEPAAERLLRRAQQVLAERLHDRAGHVAPVVDRWQRHELDESQAADALLHLLIE